MRQNATNEVETKSKIFIRLFKCMRLVIVKNIAKAKTRVQRGKKCLCLKIKNPNAACPLSAANTGPKKKNHTITKEVIKAAFAVFLRMKASNIHNKEARVTIIAITSKQ